jgi:hypothetical protein
VRIAHLRSFPKQRIGLVEEQDPLLVFGPIEQTRQVLCAGRQPGA